MAEMGKTEGSRGSAPAREAPLERLRTFGDPTLKQATHPVTVFDSRLEKLAQLMLEVMDREEGVGLAAPQIGVVSRVMVWRHPEREAERHVFVNPRIVESSETSSTAAEGCLSVPGGAMEVTRADEVVVEAQNLRGELFQVHFTGVLARIMQHEIDHLDGRLILDRTSSEERVRVLKELRERTLAAGP
ncbi:MAG: peptide deformylase [bacterium]